MPTSDIFNAVGSLGQLGGSIASLFGGSNDAANSGHQNTDAKLISAQRPYVNPIVTPGYTFGGGVLADRGNSYANANANLNTLFGNQLGALNAFSQGNLAPLSARLSPGYGQLTQAMVGAAQNKGAQTYGNLRDQLAQRNVLGASFANNQLSGQNSQNLQDENLARANAFQQEMTATLGLNQQQMDVLAQQLANANAQAGQVNATASQKLNELGVSAAFLKNVNQNDTPTSQAYKQAAIAQALGGTGGTTGTTTGTTGGTTGTGSFASLPVPPSGSHNWGSAYSKFQQTGDYAGYLAWLKANHKGGY